MATWLSESLVVGAFVTEGLLLSMVTAGILTDPEFALVFELVAAGVELAIVVTIVATPKENTLDEVLQHSVLLLST